MRGVRMYLGVFVIFKGCIRYVNVLWLELAFSGIINGFRGGIYRGGSVV